MTNFNKQGYSLSEVGQILGCHSCTVRNYVLSGHMKALVHQPGPAGRRLYRITREQLSDYLKANRERYDKALLDQFIIEEKPVEKDKDVAYPAKSLSELTGAWAGLAECVAPTPAPEPEKKSGPVVTLKRYPSYTIIVDGRVCVGNIEKRTAAAIVQALLDDRQCKFASITVNKTE